MATRGQKLFAAGPALVIAESVLALAHTGGVGVIVGFAVGAAAYLVVEDVERLTGGEAFASPSTSQKSEQQVVAPVPTSTHTKQSLAYRIFNGKSTREYTADRANEAVDVDTESPDEQENEHPIFPRSPQDETLSLGYLAKAGKLARFDPHMDMLLGKGLIVAGVQGMGKSNIAALVLESAARCDMPAVMFDLKREYHTIVDVAPNAIRAGHESLHGSLAGYFVLSVENVDEFAHYVMTGKHQAIIDLPSYGDELTSAAKVITAVLKSLMKWSKAQAEGDRLPCLTMLDEAQVFLPQNQQLSPMSSETLNALQGAFWQMCNMGRSLGFTMCFFTQSLANVQKWAIKNCQRKVVGIHVEKNDLDRCVEEVDEVVATREHIKTMPEGVGVVIGFTPAQQLVKFDKRISLHVSNTPGVARLRKPLHEQRVIHPSSTMQPYTPPTSTGARAERLPLPDAVEQLPVQLTDEERARAAWQAGKRTVGTLEKATGLPRRQAYKYYQQFLNGH